MGSITSRPQVPTSPQVVYIPQTSTTTAGTTLSNTDTEPQTSEATETVLSDTRTQSLLERNRGRFGTIQTSFRGLLSLNDQTAQRKTLLGE